MIRSSTAEFRGAFKRGAEHGQVNCRWALRLAYKAAMGPMDVSPEERMITLAIDFAGILADVV